MSASYSTLALAITQVNLPNGATIVGSGNAAAELTGAVTTLFGLQISTSLGPDITSVTESPSSGDYGVGQVVTLALGLSEVVTVAGGTPTLSLSDGGTATYAAGSGTNTLTFTYTVGAGQSTADLTATAVNLNSATLTDSAGRATNLSINSLAQTGPQINVTSPTIALDGNAFFSTSSASSAASVALTTSYVNDVIILNIEENGSAVASVSDTAGLTWQLHAVAGSGSALLYQYYAIAKSVLSADAVTVNFTGSTRR